MALGRHSIMVRSMAAVSRQGGWAMSASLLPPLSPQLLAEGCQATECTQSSCPTSTDSRMAV